MQGQLRAGRAIAIACGYVVAQLVGGAAVGLVHAAGGGDPSPDGLRSVAAAAAVTGLLCGALFLWLAVRRLGAERLLDTSPAGLAWGLGEDAGLWVAVGSGAAVAALALAAVLVWWPPAPDQPLGPLAELAASPDAAPLLLVLLIGLAPLLEEVLFRGVLLAGLSTSWGPLPGALATTLLFVGVHANELRFHWPAAVGIVSLALLTLWLRRRFRALGPPVAAHVTYNAVIVAVSAAS